VVVRPLGDPLVEVEGVSGSTDLGDGHPTLVLDFLALLQRGTSSSKNHSKGAVS
jgi:two-component system chemotaxis sensor kinase CheA